MSEYYHENHFLYIYIYLCVLENRTIIDYVVDENFYVVKHMKETFERPAKKTSLDGTWPLKKDSNRIFSVMCVCLTEYMLAFKKHKKKSMLIMIFLKISNNYFLFIIIASFKNARRSSAAQH